MNELARYGFCAALISALLIPASGCMEPPAAAEAEKPAVVRVVPLEQREIAPRIPAVGTVVPVDVSRVASGTSGNVMTFPMREGAFVEKGGVLATLRTVTLNYEIAEAEALLRQRNQQFAELQAGMRPEEIAQAKATMLSAEAESKMAEAQTRRVEDLYNRSNRAATSSERDQAIFDAERARQAYLQAKADYELKVAGYRREQIDAAQAAVEAQQHAVERLKDELEKKTIRSPFAGYLVEQQVNVGEWVEEGGTVATVARMDEVEVRVNVDESFVHDIEIGREVPIRIDALQSESITGIISQIIPRSQWATGSRSFPVIVRVKNLVTSGRPLLNEGMVARIHFRGQPRQALLAHKDAIVRSSGKPLVYVVGNENKVRAVEVVEGISDGEYIEVQGDLQAGQKLVTEGVERLRPFDEVEILSEPTVQTASSNKS